MKVQLWKAGNFHYTSPVCIYRAVRVTDTKGKIYSTSAVVQVFDALLQAKWTAMKEVLKQGDIGRAVNYVVMKKRDGCRKMFESLTIPLSFGLDTDGIWRIIFFLAIYSDYDRDFEL